LLTSRPRCAIDSYRVAKCVCALDAYHHYVWTGSAMHCEVTDDRTDYDYSVADNTANILDFYFINFGGNNNAL
jgi:hypothetical protein